ncbi:MAG: hypothetical protein OEV30_06700 [Ignavibacteria bacterium]|nr:hypothetical protein [Ignavibacteria bacterium]
MKRHSLADLAVVLTLLLVAVSVQGVSQPVDDPPVIFSERNLSGPRLGITYIAGSDESQLIQALKSKGIGRVISQFGWHFEHRLTPASGGPSFVIEWVPLIAGVEYGKFIPSLTLALGVRLPNGFEFGLGPNVLVTKAITDQAPDTFSTSLVMAFGKSFDFGGVSIPLNLVYVRSPLGERVGLIFGYAISRQ